MNLSNELLTSPDSNIAFSFEHAIEKIFYNKSYASQMFLFDFVVIIQRITFLKFSLVQIYNLITTN